MCDTPPVEKSKMTRFAFGAKCGFFGRERIGASGRVIGREQFRQDRREQQRAADHGAEERRGGWSDGLHR